MRSRSHDLPLVPTTTVPSAVGAVLGLLLLTASCSPRSAPEPDPARVERGEAALQAFLGELQGTLRTAMEEGGPTNAIRVCAEEAEEIAERHSAESLVIGRSSHRLRNPANAAEPWLASVVEEWAAAPRAARPTTRILEDGRIAVVQPLWAAPLCLGCHGEQIAPDVEKSLAERYPEDEATGFREGDLRGVAWATVG